MRARNPESTLSPSPTPKSDHHRSYPPPGELIHTPLGLHPLLPHRSELQSSPEPSTPLIPGLRLPNTQMSRRPFPASVLSCLSIALRTRNKSLIETCSIPHGLATWPASLPLRSLPSASLACLSPQSSITPQFKFAPSEWCP